MPPCGRRMLVRNCDRCPRRATYAASRTCATANAASDISGVVNVRRIQQDKYLQVPRYLPVFGLELALTPRPLRIRAAHKRKPSGRRAPPPAQWRRMGEAAKRAAASQTLKDKVGAFYLLITPPTSSVTGAKSGLSGISSACL